jgi:hypothetical protein
MAPGGKPRQQIALVGDGVLLQQPEDEGIEVHA